MTRDLLKWLACGLVGVLGLILVSWGPAGTPAGKSRVERESLPTLTATREESHADAGRRAQP
jgi:hypothetical protein